MEPRATQDRTCGKAVRGAAHRFAMACLVALAGAALPAFAEEEVDTRDDPIAKQIIDAIISGTPTLNVRGRVELAKADGLERSEAYTVRTEMGYGTRPWHGMRVYMSFENVAAATQKTYFNPTNPPNTRNQTPIADPPGTEVQSGFLEIDRKDWLNTQVRAGRQEIIYDDWRFIGDVVWRQNQQSYDAVHAKSSFGLDDLSVKYGWIGNVNRIFGGDVNNPELKDFSSNSHIVNASYQGLSQLQFTAFAYLLDLENKSSAGDPFANSNQTYGFIAKGKFDLGENVAFDYFASYAHQMDYAEKAINYNANYVHAILGLKFKAIGRFGAAYEMLGSDDGNQQFLTPLSTAHKFNGWADVYLNNGGPTGLRDMYITYAPALPWNLKGVVKYHRFWDDFSGDLRGNEIDAELKRWFGKHFMLLAKGAYFMSATDDFAEVDTWRFWVDFVVKF